MTNSTCAVLLFALSIIGRSDPSPRPSPLRTGISRPEGARADRDVISPRGAPKTLGLLTPAQGPIAPTPTLQVHLHADSGVDRSILPGARLVAEALLTAAGVATAWRLCDGTPCPAIPSGVPSVVAILQSRRHRGRCGLATRADQLVAGSIIVSVPCVASVAFRALALGEIRHPPIARHAQTRRSRGRGDRARNRAPPRHRTCVIRRHASRATRRRADRVPIRHARIQRA